MRPGATGVEQMWDAPIEEGTYALVQNFANVEALDSPLLSLEEFQEFFTSTQALRAGLNASGYVMGPPAEREHMPTLPTQVADLLSSGYADHILALILSGCELDDAEVALLSRSLVGNCLFLQHLDLSDNLFGGEGIESLAAQLLAPKRTLMLPCLRCLQLEALPPQLNLGAGLDGTEARPAMDRGLRVLADAVHDFALPALEALILHPALRDFHAFHADLAQELIPGLNALFDECDERLIYCGDGPHA